MQVRITGRTGHLFRRTDGTRTGEGKFTFRVQRVRDLALELDVRAEDVLPAVAVFRLKELPGENNRKCLSLLRGVTLIRKTIIFAIKAF